MTTNPSSNPETNNNETHTAPDTNISNKPQNNRQSNDDETNIHVPNNISFQIQSVRVKKAKLILDVAYYDIQVRTAQNTWHTTKRYSQFEALHNHLLRTSKTKLPLLPSKHYKVFTDHTKKRFIEKRRALFDNYCRKLIQSSNLKTSQSVSNFFNESKTNFKNISKVRNDSHTTHNNNISEEDEEIPPAAYHHMANDNKSLNRRQSDDYSYPDEQEITHIEIQTTRKMSDHVLYQITVSNSHLRDSFRCWTVLKRFTQFYEMDVALRQKLQITCPHILALLPPNPHRKFKFVHDHMDDNFIEERRVIMENYLAKLLRFQEVANDEQFLCFLGVE